MPNPHPLKESHYSIILPDVWNVPSRDQFGKCWNPATSEAVVCFSFFLSFHHNTTPYTYLTSTSPHQHCPQLIYYKENLFSRQNKMNAVISRIALGRPISQIRRLPAVFYRQPRGGTIIRKIHGTGEEIQNGLAKLALQELPHYEIYMNLIKSTF
ncbi:uncharacterized protein DFL_009835 [Arthrobotrys flagrans]|uniref:Uncharacterized protein n=1 Tax=Arthrobotrys flagrans TaxID=97331 RepID=A0A436ZSS2_ARTFL|nr:hypothetical protein DFL_009835 [Arthrobotrys flagrans]